MNETAFFNDPIEENKFWSFFGYNTEELIYCSKCEETHVKGMAKNG